MIGQANSERKQHTEMLARIVTGYLRGTVQGTYR